MADVDVDDFLGARRGRRCRIAVSVVCRLQGVVLVVEGDVVNLLGVATSITVNTFPGSMVMSPALGGGG